MGSDFHSVDILGEPFEQRIIELPDDDEGSVCATLVRRRAPVPTPKAVLYLHGYNDYFFQTHLADFFLERGFDFYALDLRKYGRSLRPHQTANFVRDLTEYFPEIDEAARIIRAEDGHETLAMFAHSTGGLIAALWAHARPRTGVVDGFLLNSPFFDFNVGWIMRRPVAATVVRLATWQPYRILPLSFPGRYGRSLHQDFSGEWSYELSWKPVSSFPVRLGWLHAIRAAQLRLRGGLDIVAPILVAHCAASYRQPHWDDRIHETDVVLDVRHIARWASALGRHVTIVRIDGGKHDLTLSREPARQRFFQEADRWLRAYM